MSKDIPGEHIVITVDIMGEEGQSERSLHLPFDVEQITTGMSDEVRLAISKIGTFLGIKECKNVSDQRQIDCIIFSEILNYIDYKKVMGQLRGYMKPGGRVIILNRPGRGFKELFSPQRPQGNYEIIGELFDMGFNIEMSRNLKFHDKGMDDEMVIIVAQLP